MNLLACHLFYFPFFVFLWCLSDKFADCSLLGSGCNVCNIVRSELGHGSNVRGIETTAVYDPSSQSFILHTPTESAQKYWIGGASESASLATVFAQLRIGTKEHGIHAFVVRLRDRPYGATMPGIYVEDCGVKAGLNGVDNGRIWFDRVRVPREEMLCGISNVTPDGGYSSEYDSADARFSAALAALTGGRVGIAVVSVNAAKIGLCIAVRYAMARRAFAPSPGAQEVSLLTYTSHQRRLMVPLASAYVYSFCVQDLRDMWYECMSGGGVTKDVHVLSAGFKALFTWYMSDALQNARECCGGQGYKLENRIAVLRADRDVMLTFEGANDVLLQQVARALMAEYERSGKLLNDGSSAIRDDKTAHSEKSTNALNVLEPSFVRRVFRDYELKLTRALTVQMGRLVKKEKVQSFDAWNACLNLAADAAVAHMHRRIFDMHQRHLSKAEAAGNQCGNALRLCGELWTLSLIDRNGGFLRLGCVSSAEAATAHSMLDLLCARMAHVADKLVDAFELPPHMLAPIAFDYVAHNSRARL